EADGLVVGHVAFSPVTTGPGRVGAGLAPLAVLEGFRRRGVGAGLVESGLSACRGLGVGWAVGMGEPAYYRRFGVRPGGAGGRTDGYGGGAAFQAVELAPGAMPSGAGLVGYAAEFAGLE